MIEGQKLLPEWDWDVEVKGFEDPGIVQILARDTKKVLYLLSEAGFDLRTLDGVTIAADYAETLSEIDRGFTCRSRARATNEHSVEGVAMAVGVIREGRQRTHLVLSSWIPRLLRDESEEKKRQAFGIIAHEAAHIHFAAKLEGKIPNVYGDAYSLRQYPPAFQSAAMRLWDEYAATRMSGYIDPKAAEGHQENISILIASFHTFLPGVMIAYKRHGDYQRLFVELSGFVERLLCSFAYLLGHLDSLSPQPNVTSMTQMLNTIPGGSESFWILHDRLRTLWDTQDSWQKVDVFSPLCDLIDALLRGCGVSITGYTNSWRMHILEPGSAWSEGNFDGSGSLHSAYVAAAPQHAGCQ